MTGCAPQSNRKHDATDRPAPAVRLVSLTFIPTPLETRVVINQFIVAWNPNVSSA